MKADAAAKGWTLSDWFESAGVSRWPGYDFMRGKTNSPRVAAKLTKALGRSKGFYLDRTSRKSGAAA